MLNYIDDNEARIVGCAIGEPLYSHSVKEENFLNFSVKVDRLSENSDVLVVTASERLLEGLGNLEGKKLEISGQFRSYNNYLPNGNKLILTLFAKDIREVEDVLDENEIYLNEYLCKTPVYRVTPFGREISDVLIAVNRAYNKSDYIPAICWGRNARLVKNLSVGQNIKIFGRMQSRQYQKKISEDETITKTAYEVSVNRIEIAE